MTTLNDADALYKGAAGIATARLGRTLVWEPTGTAVEAWFGTQLTNGGGNWGTQGDRAMLDRFTLANDATELLALHLWILAGSAGGVNMKGLIFSDSAGAPGALLAVALPAAIPAGGPFYVESAFPGGIALPAGNYWIGGVCDDSGAEMGSGAPTSPNAVIINGDLSYAAPPSTCPAPAANYGNDLGCYVRYLYEP